MGICMCCGQFRSDSRYFCDLYVVKMVTLTSGDVGPEGEFFFLTGHGPRFPWSEQQRFPSRGYLYMSANESFEPVEATAALGMGFPMIYCAMVDKDVTPHWEIVIRLWESDMFCDDNLLKAKIAIPIEDKVDNRQQAALVSGGVIGNVESTGKTPGGYDIYPANKMFEIRSASGKVQLKLYCKVRNRPDW